MIYILRKHILCFIIPALLCACESQQQRQSEQSISRAAALLAAAPDSALHLLARVDTTHLSRRSKGLSTVRKTFGLVLRGNIRNYLNEYYGIQDEHEQDEEEDDDTPENRN